MRARFGAGARPAGTSVRTLLPRPVRVRPTYARCHSRGARLAALRLGGESSASAAFLAASPSPRCAPRRLSARVVTAQRTGEPAWHRRQRRNRAQARTIARVAAAKALLGAHHSAQRTAFSSDGAQPPARRMSRYATAKGSLVPGAPRHPLWSCGKCGGADNWGDRSSCRFCYQDPPSSVLRRQRAATEARKQGGGGGGNAQQRAGGGGGGGARTGSASRSTSTMSYADAARTNQNKIATELAESKRQNERLQRQLAMLQSNLGATADEMDDDDGDDEGDAERVRDERIRTLTDNLKGVAAVFTEDSNEYRSKRSELDNLLRAKRECKPLNIQIQRVDRKIEKQKQRLTKAEEQLEVEKKRLKEAQADLAAAEDDLKETRSGLGELEDERKQLLLREAKAQQSSASECSAAPPATQCDGEVDAWNRTLGAIQVRMRAPGVDAQLAAQLAAVLDTLRVLCSQLPADAPVAASGAPPAPPSLQPATPAQHTAASTSVGGGGGGPAAAGQAGSSGGGGAGPGAATAAGSADTGSGASAGGEPPQGERNDGAATEPGVSEVDGESADDMDAESEVVLEGITPAQKQRIRELMGRRVRRRVAGRIRKGIDDKVSAMDQCPKKPAKGSD